MPQSPAPRRILIVRPSALGDVCRTVPVLAALRRAHPDAEIDWVVRDSYADAIAAHPALSSVVPFPRKRLAGWWRSPSAAAATWRWFRDLRRRHYDLVLDCQGLGRSGLITWATRADSRIGFRGAREFAWLGYNTRVEASPEHTVDAMLALLERLGIDAEPDMQLYTAAADAAWWSARRAELGVNGPYAVLAPTARWLSKRWPVERWQALIEPLRKRGLSRILVIGAPGEEEQVTGIAEEGETTVDSLVGTTTVGQTLAVVEQAALVVANDSAPLHMAVGFERPCVALFGPTDPARVGPYRRPESIVRRFDPAPNSRVNYRARRLGDALMREIRVEDVLERIDAVMDGEPPTPDCVVVSPTVREATP